MPLISIIGDGQMALVLADALAFRGMGVRMWGPFPDHVAKLRADRTSPRLPGFMLPREVEVTSDDESACNGADLVINAIPSQFVRTVWKRIGQGTSGTFPIVSVTKGIENETLLRPTQVLGDVMGDKRTIPHHAVCVLSGPTIADELRDRLPATMLAASTDEALASLVQDWFDVPWLRIYRSDDVVGVELAGAAKNVIALAAGMIDGLKAGDNAKSALLARGLAEIARLGTALGARIETFFGVAGVGDLATTCFSPHGRNRTCGERLGRGETLDDIIRSTTSVVEGVPTARSIRALAERSRVDMPICRAVHAILFEGLRPRDAITHLMRREQKVERIG